MRAEYRALLVGVERVGGVVGCVMRAEYRALLVSVLSCGCVGRLGAWNAGRACGLPGCCGLLIWRPMEPSWVASSFRCS
mgnify:CR=1 FL=1